jgi:hypothetical protein
MPCEKCGYCKECGRSNQDWHDYQLQPTYPIPPWDGSFTCLKCGKRVGMYEVHPCYAPTYTYTSTSTQVFPEVK